MLCPNRSSRLVLLSALPLTAALVAGCQTAPSSPTDETAVARAPIEIQRIARNNDCFKCHAVERDKDGPSWRSVAEKYRDQPDAHARLYKHLTTAPIIDLKGDPEKHKQLKDLSQQEIDALIDWILTL
jgi:cytochrome c